MDPWPAAALESQVTAPAEHQVSKSSSPLSRRLPHNRALWPPLVHTPTCSGLWGVDCTEDADAPLPRMTLRRHNDVTVGRAPCGRRGAPGHGAPGHGAPRSWWPQWLSAYAERCAGWMYSNTLYFRETAGGESPSSLSLLPAQVGLPATAATRWTHSQPQLTLAVPSRREPLDYFPLVSCCLPSRGRVVDILGAERSRVYHRAWMDRPSGKRRWVEVNVCQSHYFDSEMFSKLIVSNKTQSICEGEVNSVPCRAEPSRPPGHVVWPSVARIMPPGPGPGCSRAAAGLAVQCPRGTELRGRALP